MTPQRKTGIVCTILSALVVINYTRLMVFDFFYWFCVAILAVFAVSIFIESTIAKIGQVSFLFAIGATLQFHGDASAYIGITILSVASLHCYTHGFLDRNFIEKAIAFGVFVAVVVGVSTYGTVSSIILRMAMSASIILLIWIPMKTLIDKARIADAMKVERLEATVVELLDAAMVLVEANEKRNKDGK